MSDESLPAKKGPARAGLSVDEKILIGRQEAAAALSISQRALDYLVANKQLQARRIGSRVLIPRSELLRFARADHPEPIAS
jgi:excisionase family DNA binding protein